MIVLRELMDRWRADTTVGRRVVAFGASNTSVLWHSEGRHGWPCWLMVALRGYVGHHVSLTNAGISGDSTADMLGRIERDVLPHNPSLVLITAGGNDIKQFPADVYRRNLARLVDMIADRGAVSVLQTYYAAVTDEADEVYRGFPAYMQACADLAAESDVPCIDQHAMFHPWYLAEPDEYREIMRDALHLNPLGNAVMGTLCVRHFGLPDPELPAVLAEAVPAVLDRMARYARLPEPV